MLANWSSSGSLAVRILANRDIGGNLGELGAYHRICPVEAASDPNGLLPGKSEKS
jgi:hypothetical protein